MQLADFARHRRALPNSTYHLTCFWPDGDVLSQESHVRSRNAVYDVAQEMVQEHGCTVEIIRVQRNPFGKGPLSVSDVTADFHAARKILAPLEAAE